ncbi:MULTISPECIES: methyltransferase domain-containing protein [Streptomyces]|uniref:Protein-L-isoaspartate O-methyltransferase n=1 Tax=Streptomyces solicathayae TaxID=3081768 RepID=A0ABZ0LNA3_9ACTN|nr:methyltransferase domain-containing protein [Streptomyces sp. HUAS YS2]WOX20963.1 methyltransferase domain-containing protein [Streptomyces sp. HUAS YS2]
MTARLPDTAPEDLVAELLAAIAEQLGEPLPDTLQRAFRTVPRHRFLPERIWVRDGAGDYERVDRADRPDEWMAAAYSDAPLVTQFTDGLPSSSASMPSTVVRTLLLADLTPSVPGQQDHRGRVLELGTGTGFDAALLCTLMGAEQVTSVELDPKLAARGERNLKAVGFAPRVVAGDAAAGWSDGGPYDQILATFSVDHVPAAWLEQVRPGGRIVTPWTSRWCRYGTLALTAGQDGGAEGRFHSFASFMPMRPPAGAAPPPGAAPAEAVTTAAETVTDVSPWAVAGGDLDAEFHIGLTVPGAHFAWDTSGRHTHTRLEIRDDTTGSWATIDYDGDTAARFTVAQAGPRALWDEVAAAYERWERLGRPSVDRYGLTVDAHGSKRLWFYDFGQLALGAD